MRRTAAAGGNKVSPQVIEDVLLSLPQVTEAAAFGVPDRMGVVQIWAAIVAATPVDMAVLQAARRAKLADKAPKFALQVKGLPRNANGKILRTELIAFATARRP
jgi:long-chain acyl-CoA synthetase